MSDAPKPPAALDKIADVVIIGEKMRERSFVVAASVRAPELSEGGLVCPSGACLGIDIQAVRAAPGDELVRIDYGANNDVPGALQFALGALGALLPVFVSCEQLVRIIHDLKNARVILAAVPDDADGSASSNVVSKVGMEASIKMTTSGKTLPPYRPSQAAQRLGVSERAIIQAAKKGRLAGVQLNKIWLINREQVDRLARGEPA